jgi:hypothetical protein
LVTLTPWRFVLTDAQHVIAVELGLRSWPDLTRTVRVADAAQADGVAEGRRETRIDTGLHYRPGDPVCVWLVRRERRVSVTDSGAAIERAGWPSFWHGVAHRVCPELDVNVSRLGVIWLPVVKAGAGEDAIVRRIAAASLSFYQELLDLDG